MREKQNVFICPKQGVILWVICYVCPRSKCFKRDAHYNCKVFALQRRFTFSFQTPLSPNLKCESVLVTLFALDQMLHTTTSVLTMVNTILHDKPHRKPTTIAKQYYSLLQSKLISNLSPKILR